MTTLGRSAIVMDMEGNAEAGLGRVADMLRTLAETGEIADRAISALREPIETTGEEIPTLGDTWDDTLRGMAEAAHAVGADMLQSLGARISDYGAIIHNWGAGVIEGMFGMGAEILSTAASMETLHATFRRLYGEDAPRMIARMEEIGARTSFTTAEVGGLATMLRTAGVDALSVDVASATGETISSLEALSDLASTKGTRGMGLLMPALQNFLGGDVTSLQRRMDIMGPALTELQTGMAGIADGADAAQQRFELLATVIGEHFGGIGASLSNTIEFLIPQFEDMRQLIFTDIGEGALDEFRPLLIEMVSFLRDLRTETSRGGGIVDVFRDFAHVVAQAATFLWRIVAAVVSFAQSHPRVVRWLASMTAIAAVLAMAVGSVLGLIGTIITATGVVLGLQAAAAYLGITLAGVWASLWPILAALGTMAAVAGTIYGAYRSNFLGLGTLFDRIAVSVTALYEVFTTMSDDGIGRLSGETFGELERLGMTDFFIGLTGTIFRLWEALRGMWMGFSQAMTTAWAIIEPIFTRFMGHLFGVEQASQVGAGGILDMINSITPDTWKRFGEEAGRTLGQIITAVLILSSGIIALNGFLDTMDAHWNQIASTFERIDTVLRNMMDVGSLGLVSAIFGGGLFNMGGAPAPVMGPSQAMTSEFIAAHAVEGAPATSNGGGGEPTTAAPVTVNATVVLDHRTVGTIVTQTQATERARLGVGG